MFDNHERLAGMRSAWEGRVRAWRTCTLGQEFGDNPFIGKIFIIYFWKDTAWQYYVYRNKQGMVIDLKISITHQEEQAWIQI